MCECVMMTKIIIEQNKYYYYCSHCSLQCIKVKDISSKAGVSFEEFQSRCDIDIGI